MTRKRKPDPLDWTSAVAARLRPPLVFLSGSPEEVAERVGQLAGADVVCFQMDLFQAERLQEELHRRSLTARVVTAPDLWDLPADFQTAVYAVPLGGERGLKLDLVEQAFHVLRPHGSLVVLSPYEKEQLFPSLLKKVFGRAHTPAAGQGMVHWATREGDRPRRRHEVTFHVRWPEEEVSLRFLSRPGVFSYGRFDNGARALVETMVIEPGDRVLDVGCGCGTNGVIAGRRGGPTGHVMFLDSDLRAVALAEHNARTNGLASFQAIASSRVEGPAEGGFDVALANPPYYAQGSIARLFIERSRALLRAGGRFYLVTRQPDLVGPMVAECFGVTEVIERRGYQVLCAVATPPG